VVKEREFQSWVIQTAEALKWRVWHVPAPMRPIPGGKMVPEKRARGLPDLIMLHDDPPRLIFAELKGGGRHPLSEDQKEFLRLASDIAKETTAWPHPYGLVGVYSWRPGAEDVIEAILR